MRRHDLKGKRFGHWTVLEFHSRDRRGNLRWLCLCKCGVKRTVTGTSLVNERSKSCGCLKTQITTERFTKHGLHGAPAYGSWMAMMNRCNCLSNKAYSDYGGRGISVCERWLSVENFLADMGPKPKGMSLDRIDNDRDYEPDNCKWSTPSQQQRNTRNNRCLTYKGQTRCLAEWAEIFNLNYGTLRTRIKRGWSAERALNERPMGESNVR